MESLFLKNGITDKLSGKIVSKVAYFSDENDFDKNYCVLTFTDGTYLNLRIEKSEDDEPYLENCRVHPLRMYSPSALGYVVNGNFRYYDHIRYLIDIKVIEPLDENIVLQAIQDNQKRQEEFEYKKYLELKKKYENYTPSK